MRHAGIGLELGGTLRGGEGLLEMGRPDAGVGQPGVRLSEPWVEGRGALEVQEGVGQVLGIGVEMKPNA